MTNNVNKIIYVKDEVKFNFFPPIEGVDRSKLKITTEGIYSISDNESSDHLVHLIEKYFKSSDITITDATGNNGSDTIALGIKFAHVNSIELDKTNFMVLQHNVKNVYNLDNVNLYRNDSLNMLNRLNQDVIYIDAPWGGKDYKKNKNMELYLSGKSMGEIYNEFKTTAKLFIFKLPKNYDFNNFISTTMTTKYFIFLYKRNNEPKFYFLCVDTSS